MKPPSSPREMPAVPGKLFVFSQPQTAREPACWRVAALETGKAIHPWPRRYPEQDEALQAARVHAAEHGLAVVLGLPRFTARLR